MDQKSLICLIIGHQELYAYTNNFIDITIYPALLMSGLVTRDLDPNANQLVEN